MLATATSVLHPEISDEIPVQCGEFVRVNYWPNIRKYVVEIKMDCYAGSWIVVPGTAKDSTIEAKAIAVHIEIATGEAATRAR